MSCNGCRVLRKGCSESCLLRAAIQCVDTAEAQGHATVFVAKFFGRAGLMSFIANVQPNQRPALFQSLLFEACGRTINPVSGAAGLLWTGNWHLCQAAVETVLRGGALRQLQDLITDDHCNTLAPTNGDAGLYSRPKPGVSSFSAVKRHRKPTATEAAPSPSPSPETCDLDLHLTPNSPIVGREDKCQRRPSTPSMNSEGSVTTSHESGVGFGCGVDRFDVGDAAPKLLNLFV